MGFFTKNHQTWRTQLQPVVVNVDVVDSVGASALERGDVVVAAAVDVDAEGAVVAEARRATKNGCP